MSYVLDAETESGHVLGCSFDGMFVPGQAGLAIAREDVPGAFDADDHLKKERIIHSPVNDSIPVPAAAGFIVLKQTTQSV